MLTIEPPPDNPPRFDPVYVTDEDLDDLSTFTGMTKEACLERLRQYSPLELAEAWRAANPKNTQSVVGFYATTDLYVWELMQWHTSPARRPYWRALSDFVTRFPPSRWRMVYDFGCGIGTDGLFLAGRGYDVTLVDVESPTLEFARHRAKRRGLIASFQGSASPLPRPTITYDAVICFDVFEHLPQPLAAARILIDHLRPGGILLQQGTFHDDGDSPCHLHDHIGDFGGYRWYAELAGFGMKGLGGFTFRKERGLAWRMQRARHLAWKLTGMWLVDARGRS